MNELWFYYANVNEWMSLQVYLVLFRLGRGGGVALVLFTVFLWAPSGNLLFFLEPKHTACVVGWELAAHFVQKQHDKSNRKGLPWV